MLCNISLRGLGVVFLFIISLAQAFGEGPIIFGSFPISGLVIDENNGPLIELTIEIAKRGHLEIEIIIQPRKRILYEFLSKKIDAFFPALDIDFNSPVEVITSKGSLFLKKDFIFTRSGEPILATIQELEGKTVGLTLGYPYSIELTDNPLIVFDIVADDTINVKKLMTKRIDAFVAEEYSGLSAIQTEGGLEQVQYDPFMPISESRDYYAFQNTENGKILRDIFSRILDEMKNDGSYTRIIRKEM